MPFFKFRRGDAAAVPQAASAAQTQSVEMLRKRARHRLMGASVLVLLGVVGFPLLFETQPRPVAVDIPIEIPGKNSVKPLTVPAPGAAAAPEPAKAPQPVPAPAAVVAAASPPPAEAIYPTQPVPAPAEPAPLVIKKEARPESRQDAKPEARAETKPKPEAKPEQKADARPAPAAEPRPAPKPAAASDDGARATALLNGAAPQQPARPAEPPRPAATEGTKAVSAETKGRMVVQVGAFADAAKADETRRKLEKAGLSTYTQIADTKDGKRIRVRVGPFSSKAEAEKAVNKIRSLDLPVAILSF
ncbi:MAG: SPOR domain-containing protein [Polaromonas sp.]|nr:SPOR domain-containing protein [Polaromonas sp.]